MKAMICILVLVAALHAAVAVNNTTVTSRHPSVPYWSKDCPLPSVLGIGVQSNVECCCSITDNGAIGDNSTLNTIAIQSTIDGCHERCAVQQSSGNPIAVVVYVPKGMFRTGSLAMLSNTRLHIGRGGAIYGSDNPQDYPLGPMLPSGYETGKSAMFRALISGYNLENVSVTGENYGYPPGSFAQFSTHPKLSSWNDTKMSVIDGVGWKWWCKARSMPIPQDYCEGFNPNNETLPSIWQRPKLIEFYNCTNIVLDRFTARNSPLWFIHPFLSKNIDMTNLTILAPREVGNTDGLDPDSSQNILMDTCYIDVGDDGVSIKSSNHSGKMIPTRNVIMRNLAIKSRNWCIGSATFGGIYNLLFEDSTIGDLEMATSPWAIKFKSHRYYPGPIENVTVRNIAMGKLGPNPWMYPDRPGSAFIIELSYGHPPPKRRSGAPLFRNVTFENISVESAGEAGHIVGFPEDCLQGLSLRNITIKGGAAKWTCDYIDLDSLDVSDVTPPVTCTGGCVDPSRSNLDSHLRAYQGNSKIPQIESNDILSTTE